ncbi:MAG: alpha/beta fold hydrolase [Alsobacter sp.]
MKDKSFRMGCGATAVLLIHGLTGTPAEMKWLGKQLAAAGFSVYGVQLAGHCGTERELAATTWVDWQDSVLRVLDEVRRTHRQVILGGLSAGALLALRVAAERPLQVAGLMLFSTTLVSDGWSMPRTRALLGPWLALGLWRFWRFEERAPYGIKDERTRERILAAMQSGDSSAAGHMATPGACVRQLHRLSKVVRRELDRIRCPALVVHAEEDDVASRGNADLIASRLRGDVRKVILQDCYHLVLLDRERHRVAQESLSFMGAFDAKPERPILRLVRSR